MAVIGVCLTVDWVRLFKLFGIARLFTLLLLFGYWALGLMLIDYRLLMRCCLVVGFTLTFCFLWLVNRVFGLYIHSYCYVVGIMGNGLTMLYLVNWVNV